MRYPISEEKYYKKTFKTKAPVLRNKMGKRKRAPVETQPEDEPEERYFLDPKSVSIHLYCSICQEVFQDPQRAPCGHSFCSKCITPWLKQSKTCPEDRKPLKPGDLHHDFILENIIGDQQVACPYRVHGCEHIGQLAVLSSHKKSCSFNPANLPGFMKESLTSPSNASVEKVDIDEDGDLLTPVKPSLKMRLFTAGGGQRDLLCSMFDKEEKS